MAGVGIVGDTTVKRNGEYLQAKRHVFCMYTYVILNFQNMNKIDIGNGH